MDVLRKTQQDLNDGQAKLDKMAATIDTESVGFYYLLLSVSSLYFNLSNPYNYMFLH